MYKNVKVPHSFIHYLFISYHLLLPFKAVHHIYILSKAKSLSLKKLETPSAVSAE